MLLTGSRRSELNPSLLADRKHFIVVPQNVDKNRPSSARGRLMNAIRTRRLPLLCGVIRRGAGLAGSVVVLAGIAAPLRRLPSNAPRVEATVRRSEPAGGKAVPLAAATKTSALFAHQD